MPSWLLDANTFPPEDYNFLDLLDTNGPNSTRCYMLVLYGLIRSNGWSTLVELGGFRGNTTAILARAAHLNNPAHGTLTVLEADSGCAAALRDRFTAQPHITIHHTRAQDFPPFPCDFLFVDDEHETDAVLHHWATWSPLIHLGGCIAFHDAYENPSVAAALAQLFPAPGWQHLCFPGDAGLLLARRIE